MDEWAGEAEIPIGQRRTKDAPVATRRTRDAVPIEQRVTRDAPMTPREAKAEEKPRTIILSVTPQQRIDDLVTALQSHFPGAKISHAGSGGGGVTLRVVKPDGTSLAVKMARISWEQRHVDMLKKDPEVFAKAQAADPEGSAHLVAVVGLTEVFTRFTNETALQMEDATEGTLASHLADFGPGRNPLEVLQAWRQIALGVRALHRAKLVHRDLNPENILVTKTKDGALKYLVGDFGVVFSPGDTLVPGMMTGTIPYMSKGALEAEAPTPQFDIHSLQITFMEMLMGHSVWNLDFDNPGNNVKTLTVEGKKNPLLQALPYEISLKVDARERKIVDSKFETIDQMIVAIDEAIADIKSSPGPSDLPGASP